MDERQINIFTNPLETVEKTSTAFCVEWKWLSKQVQYLIKYSLKLTTVKKDEMHTCITCSMYNRNKHVKTEISYILCKNLIKIDKMAL